MSRRGDWGKNGVYFLHKLIAITVVYNVEIKLFNHNINIYLFVSKYCEEQ